MFFFLPPYSSPLLILKTKYFTVLTIFGSQDMRTSSKLKQIVRNNVIGISNIFQHGEEMVVLKPGFFIMIFQHFRELCR